MVPYGAGGGNDYGQLGDGTTDMHVNPVQVIGLEGIIAVAAGGNQTLALKNDGTVWTWGDNYFGQLGIGDTWTRSVPSQIPSFSGIVAIGSGNRHSIALKGDGTVWGWGANDLGQLGNTANGYAQTTPVQIELLSGMRAISAGGIHSLALKGDGTMWAWGHNNAGQLGDGTILQSSIPTQITDLPRVTAFAAGLYHSVAVDLDGSVWGWGGNLSGQLGDGVTDTHAIPTQVTGLSGTTAAAAGDLHSLALHGDGSVWFWGDNARGQAGDGTKLMHPVPMKLDALTDVVSIAATTDRNAIVKSDGTVWAWGLDIYGRGNQQPAQINGITDIIAVAAGANPTLALRRDGTVWAWGNNSFGEVGDGTTTRRLTPVQVLDLVDVTAIAAGSCHSLALNRDGTVSAWGRNDYGQLGDDTAIQRLTPVPVEGLSGVVAIAAGSDWSIALKNDGSVWAWGYNLWGKLGDGTTIDRHTPVQVSGLSGVIAIATGFDFSLALKSDGSIWRWGKTPVQVANVPGAMKVTAGLGFGMALKQDGTIWGWGDNSYGQLGDGTKSFLPKALNNINLGTDAMPPVVTAFPGEGSYMPPLMVAFASNEASTVYYTTDGSLPTTDSSVYTGPIPITMSTTVSYLAKDFSGNISVPQTLNYTILPTNQLSITFQGGGTGKISLSNGKSCTGSCTALIPVDGTVTLTATPTQDSSFSGWSGACSSISGNECTVVMDSGKAVTAIFDKAFISPEIIASGQLGAASINSLGEVVWSQQDGQSFPQLYSNIRGQLTNDTGVAHFSPAVNNHGDLAWVEYSNGYPSGYTLRGIIAGQHVTFAASDVSWIGNVDINDLGEVVWAQQDGMYTQIYSSVRGQLTGGAYNWDSPRINNSGDVVFTRQDPAASGPTQIYIIPAQSALAAPVSNDGLDHRRPVINDSGEIIWVQTADPGSGAQVVSAERGVLASVTNVIWSLDLNNCGDVVYIEYDSNQNNLIRLGDNAPCMAVAERQFLLAVGKSTFNTGSGLITSSPAGINLTTTTQMATSAFPANAIIILTATPDADSDFTGWSGACSGIGPCQLTMDLAKSVTAAFQLKPTDTTPPATISSLPGGSYTGSQSANLTCADGSGSGCAGTWYCLGAGCTPDIPYAGDIPIISSNTIRFYSRDVAGNAEGINTINYTILAADYAVNLTVTGTGAGTASSTPAGIVCSTNCSARFTSGMPVTLHAAPARFSIFSGWSGACSGDGDCVLAMTGDHSVTATFTRNTSRLTRVGDSLSTYYPTIQAAYNGAAGGNVIRVWGTAFMEELIFAEDKNVILSGGYDEEYVARDGVTTIRGTLIVSKGTVIVEGLQISP